jgi:hypothetical protein
MIIDPLYILFILPGLILALVAQFLVWRFYSKYSKVDAGTGMTGLEAAKLLNNNEGYDVELKTAPGKLNDFYNPLTNTVSLSEDNVQNISVANIAVVAHEFGHVQQKHSASVLFGIRTAMVPFVNFGSGVGYILILIGILLSITGLAWVGVILFSLTAIFSFVTIPIEVDASRRGMQLIKKHKLINTNKLSGARLVLIAAALTYVAALVQSLGQLLYFVLLVSGRD